VDDQLSSQAEILVSEAMDMTGSWYAASWCVFSWTVLLKGYWYKLCVQNWGFGCGKHGDTIMNTDLCKILFCWPCFSIYAWSETNLMHCLSSVYSVTTSTCFRLASSPS
jgi:hypothetical protein